MDPVGLPAPVHQPGEIVYLKTDPEQMRRIVTGIQWSGGTTMLYGLSCNTMVTWHYGYEISKQRSERRSAGYS